MEDAMPNRVFVWDIVVRLFHWTLVAAFVANAFFTKPGKDLHETVGYVVVGLLALRLVWGLVGSRHARFSDFRPDPVSALGQLREMATGRRHAHAGHSPLGALMIYNLLVTLAAIGLTGWMMTTVTFFGVDWVEEAHEALVTWAEISIVLHIAAVIFESRRLGVNLPKSMVTGYKVLPDRASGV
jgi:cytochrome b